MNTGAQEKQLLYRNLARVRRLDEYGIELAARGQISQFWHSCRGSEAVGVAACTQLRVDDYLYYHYRGHGLPYLVPKGLDPRELFAEHEGKETGTCKGVGGIHAVAPEIGVYGWSGILGPQFGISAGYAYTAQLNGRQQIAISFFGDGTASKGQFHEGLNVSALWKLPLVWVLENNGVSIMTPIEDHFAAPSGHYVELASAYGIPVDLIDGRDVEAVHRSVGAAIERARRGDGPSFIECAVDRRYGHVMGLYDTRGTQPRTREELDAIDARDSVDRYREQLLAEGVLTAEIIDDIASDLERESEDIARFCAESATDDPAFIDLAAATYAD